MNTKPQEVLRNFLKCENKCEVKPKDSDICEGCDYHWDVDDFRESIELAIKSLEREDWMMTKEQIKEWCLHHICSTCRYSRTGVCTVSEYLIQNKNN